MVYSEVVKAGLILPKKQKYTMRDVNYCLVNSLFESRTLSKQEAIFVAKCSAVFHDTEWAATIDSWDPAREMFRTSKSKAEGK